MKMYPVSRQLHQDVLDSLFQQLSAILKKKNKTHHSQTMQVSMWLNQKILLDKLFKINFLFKCLHFASTYEEFH